MFWIAAFDSASMTHIVKELISRGCNTYFSVFLWGLDPSSLT